ncbi:MAG TPA: AAA family ATPase [Dehalococcoidia bacterium]|nr:AAA family ATPase [Dehalococcoidia bacterium]
MHMFEQKSDERKKKEAPLAARMRPSSLHAFVGQGHLVGKGHVLRTAIESGQIPSTILWGPPGSGKTTLASIIANSIDSHFSSVSAVSAGVADLRRIIDEARERHNLYQRKTILFIDEIHRFNKAQQDAVLPYVEDGTVTLIGATTENPSFEVNAPLLSRCQMLTLNPLNEDEIRIIILRALKDQLKGLGQVEVEFEDEAMLHLVMMSNNDARVALNALELAVMTTPPESDGKRRITLQVIEDAVQQRALAYDKAGEQHFDIISALHKSMRGSDPNAALYWLGRMLEAGEDPLYIIRRLVRFASEDVGMADPQALVVAMAAQQAVHFIGMPEANLAMAEAVVYLAAAPKSNSLYQAYNAVQEQIKRGPNDPVPLHLRNAVTPLMKESGYGKGYKYAHDYPGHFVKQDNLPESLKGRSFYTPGDQGHEKEIAERLDAWWTGETVQEQEEERSETVINTHVEFPCGDITLEGELHFPETETDLPGRQAPFPTVIVCHPHSLYGGNMNNLVVVSICETLNRQGITTLRFNFRGVGNSGGQFAGGVGEREDVLAALEYLSGALDINHDKIGLAGYSFGGSVVLPVALEEERFGALALISPALTDNGWAELEKFTRPKIIIVGGSDSVIQVDRFQQVMMAARHPMEYHMVPGVDHFWTDHEDELAGDIAGFFEGVFTVDTPEEG